MSGDDIIKTITAVVLIAVLIPIGIYIYDTIYTEIPDDLFNVTNETFNTGANNTYIQLGHDSIVANTESVRNATLLSCAESSDYVINLTDGTINANNTTRLPDSATAYINYSYHAPPVMAQNTLPVVVSAYRLLVMVLIVMAAVVIIGILLKAFGRGGIGV